MLRRLRDMGWPGAVFAAIVLVSAVDLVWEACS